MSARALFRTWLALVALAAVSFALAEANLGAVGVPIALAIAALKAALVAVVFMELAIEKFTVRAAIVVGLALVTIAVTLSLADVVTRPTPPLVPRP